MVAGAAGYVVHSATTDEASAAVDNTAPVDFHGEHQAGITTPAQDRLHFATFDLTSTKRDDLIKLLKTWTAAAAQMTAGHDVGEYGAVSGPGVAPPEDTGEAVAAAYCRPGPSATRRIPRVYCARSARTRIAPCPPVSSFRANGEACSLFTPPSGGARSGVTVP